MTKFIFSTSKVVQLNNFPELDAMIFKIFQDAISYEKEVVKLLSCDNLTKNQKTLLVQPMNGLTLKEFIEKWYLLYKQGKISRSIFQFDILFNDFRHRHYVIKYYKNEEVIDLLVKLKKDKTMLDLGDTFEEVLSGKGWDEQKERYQSALIGAP